MTTKYDFQPFETLAGSTFCYSPAETVADLIECARQVDSSNLQGADWQTELDANDDDQTEDSGQILADLADDIIDYLNDAASLPPSCTIGWQDGEVMVIPYIDHDAPRIEDGSDIFYAVNERGNVTCYAWDGSAYRSVWDMV